MNATLQERLLERGDKDSVLASNEIERLADRLSDCWLLLDAVARGGKPEAAKIAAANLLREQQCPGWKVGES